MEKPMNKTAAMIGAGLIGRAWAMVFARAGWTVRLHDTSEAQLADASVYVSQSLAEQQAAGLCDDAAAAHARISYVASLADAVTGAEWVHEQLPETLELKRDVFAKLDRLAGESTILASSTSAIPPAKFTEGLANGARCLVAHPVNPPHLVPLVDLLRAPWTAASTIES